MQDSILGHRCWRTDQSGAQTNPLVFYFRNALATIYSFAKEPFVIGMD